MVDSVSISIHYPVAAEIAATLAKPTFAGWATLEFAMDILWQITKSVYSELIIL